MRTRAAARRIVCVLFYGKQRASGGIPHNKLKEAAGCVRGAGVRLLGARAGNGQEASPSTASEPSAGAHRPVRGHLSELCDVLAVAEHAGTRPKPERPAKCLVTNFTLNRNPKKTAHNAQLTTNEEVCSMQPLKRIACPSFPPSVIHVTSQKFLGTKKGGHLR